MQEEMVYEYIITFNIQPNDIVRYSIPYSRI